MALYALIYRYIDDPDTVSRHRPDHRSYLTSLEEAKELLISGPIGDPGPAGGLLIFDVDSADRLEEITQNDPFTKAGVIEGKIIQSWSLFIGKGYFPTVY